MTTKNWTTVAESTFPWEREALDEGSFGLIVVFEFEKESVKSR